MSQWIKWGIQAPPPLPAGDCVDLRMWNGAVLYSVVLPICDGTVYLGSDGCRYVACQKETGIPDHWWGRSIDAYRPTKALEIEESLARKEKVPS